MEYMSQFQRETRVYYDKGWNTAYYNNPEMDELYTKLFAETDMTKRKEILYAMQMTIAEDVPYGLLYRRKMIDPVRTDRFEGRRNSS